MMSLELRAYTRAEAILLREQGYDLSGCAMCFQIHGTTPAAPTQWPAKVLKMNGHRQLCPKHYEEESR